MALSLGACSDPEVVAEVGSSTLTRTDVALAAKARGGASGPGEVLDALMDRALLAEAARRERLEREPEVAARLAAAEREILASTYLDRLTREALAEPALRDRYRRAEELLARTEVHVAHVIIRVTAEPNARARAQARINALYARARGGEDFAELARKESEDPLTAARGGDLGPIREGQIDPRFFAAASALEQGQVSDPFETSFGFHVAKALEDPRQVVPPFEQVRGALAAEARRELEVEARVRLAKEIDVTRFPERLPPPAGVDGGAAR